MRQKYVPLYGKISYGMTVYQDRFANSEYQYWILYNKKIPEFTPYSIPKSKWICFPIPSQDAKQIQEVIHTFYLTFYPSCPYCLKNLPELEYYHDNITEFLIPLED